MNSKFINYKTLLGILTSAAGFYLGFKEFEFVKFYKVISSANIWLFILSMLLMVLVIFLRSWRWKYILLTIKDISQKEMFAAEMIGYFGNNVFPLRMGELLRSYSLGQMEDISTSSAFGTIVIERVLDIMSMTVILFIGVLFFDQMPDWLQTTSNISIIVLVITIISAFIMAKNIESLKNWFKGRFDKYKGRKFYKMLRNFMKGIIALEKNPHLGLLIFQSFIIWAVNISVFWVVGLVFGEFFSIFTLLLIFFVTSFIIAIPSAPGYMGTYHAGAIGALKLVGYGMSEAQAIAIIMHATGFLPLTLVGGYYFLKSHIDIENINKEEVVSE